MSRNTFLAPARSGGRRHPRAAATHVEVRPDTLEVKVGDRRVRVCPEYLFSDDGVWFYWDAVKGTARVGASDFRLPRDEGIAAVELPEAGMSIEVGDELAAIEGEEGASLSVVSPVDGVIVAINRELTQHPDRVGVDPYGAGWFVELRPATWPLAGLHDAASFITSVLTGVRTGSASQRAAASPPLRHS